MSFGFSIGDFVQCIKLVNDIRCRIIDAPGQWISVAEDVKSLATALQEANFVLPRKDLTPSQEDVLGQLQRSCEGFLEKLRDILDRAQVVDQIKGRRSKITVAWKKVTWDQKEIDGLRSQIAWNLDALRTLLQQVTSNAIFEIKSDVSRLHEREDTKEKDKKRKAILDWLSTIDHVSRQRDVAIKRQPGTGLWLLDSPEFTDWLQQDAETMLCQGIPGTGKTVLASVVVSHLREKYQDDSSVGIAYIYFTYQPKQEQVLSDLLGSLVKQLIPEHQPIPTEIEELFDGHRNGKDPMTERDLRAAWSVVVKPLSKIFIVLDALDEYHASAPKDLEAFLTAMLEFRKIHPFALFATSRYVSKISSQLGSLISKDIRAHEDDVLLYINARMSEMRWKIFDRDKIHASIRKEVLKASDGMFLLARLHMDTLVDQPTVGDLEDALKDLPKGLHELDQTYDQAMQRINSQRGKNRELAHKILIWVIYAQRALSTWEIREALAIKPRQSSFNGKYRPELETIGSLCAGLVTIDTNSEIVQLVHYTTKEYFLTKEIFPDAHTIIAEICITCLSFDIFQNMNYLAYPWQASSTRIYKYAANFWDYHVKASSYRQDLVFDFLRDSGKVSSCVNFILSQGCYATYFASMETLGIGLVALVGLHELMDTLIEGGQSPSTEDVASRTPLCFAILGGKYETVKHLVTHYDVHLDSDFQDNFLLAVQRDQLDIVEFMLPLMDPQAGLPLLDAAEKGHLRIVDCLLKDGRVNLNFQDREQRTALHYAIQSRHEPVAMRLLTTRGVDLDLRDRSGVTPFLLAAQHGQLAVVEHLLKRPDIDYNVADRWGQTAFVGAVKGGHVEIVKLLLCQTKVQPDATDSGGRTAISYAAQGGHLEVLQLLQDYNIPADTEDEDGKTPFWYAASEGHLDVIKFLFSQHTVRTETKDRDGRTPFSAAAGYGFIQVLHFLYSNCKADINSKCHKGLTPLFHAILDNPWNLGLESMKYLVNIGADMNTKDKNGRTPLEIVFSDEETELLLRAGAGSYEYAIEKAVRHFGYESEVHKLVKARWASKNENVESVVDSNDPVSSRPSKSPTDTAT